MSRLATALLVISLARPVTLLGQASASTASIQPGARVRITQAGQKPRVAVVVTQHADTLLVRWQDFANTVSVPLAEVSRLDVSSGRHRNLGKGAVLGTLGGGALGAVIGAASYSPCTDTGFFGCLDTASSRGDLTVAGGAVGGALGLIVGALVGLPSREGWRQVSLDARRVAVAATPRGQGTDLGVLLRF